MSKHFFFLALLISSSVVCFSQTKSQKVQSIMNSVSIDSLLNTVSQFTGEEDVILNGNTCRIKTRNACVDSAYTYLAEEYLLQRFRQMGYTALADTFNTNAKYTGSTNIYRHIYAIKPGVTNPDKFYYVCAHLDCDGDYQYLNYGADDNGSGTAVVLEAARIFANIPTKYSLVFILFNSEECSWGQCHFDKDTTITKNILGALNFDMMAYDSNNDGVMYLFGPDNNTTKDLITTVNNVNTLTGNKLVINREYKPAGDDFRFVHYNIPAVAFIEDWKINQDMNPGYHSNNDRMDKFNNTYYHNIAKLGLGTLAELVLVDNESSVIEDGENSISIVPNPAVNFLNLKFSNNFTQNINISIINNIGNEVIVLNEITPPSSNTLSIDISNLPDGIYFVKISTGKTITTAKFIKSKK